VCEIVACSAPHETEWSKGLRVQWNGGLSPTLESTKRPNCQNSGKTCSLYLEYSQQEKSILVFLLYPAVGCVGWTFYLKLWRKDKIRFLSKHILVFRVVRCSRESVISAGTTPQDCFRNSHHHPLLVVWNLKEYDFFFALIASQRQWCSLTHALQFRSALTCSENIFKDGLRTVLGPSRSQIELHRSCPIKLRMFSNWLIFNFCLGETAWNLAI